MQRAVCPTLIGREDEVASLEDALLEAGLGEGRVIVLSGLAGLGKTRLASELRGQAEKLGFTVLWGSCSEARLEVPFLPFLEAIGNHLVDTDLERLRSDLGPNARDLTRLFPQIGAEVTTLITTHEVKDTKHWLASPMRMPVIPRGPKNSSRSFVDPQNPARVAVLFEVPDMDTCSDVQWRVVPA